MSYYDCFYEMHERLLRQGPSRSIIVRRCFQSVANTSCPRITDKIPTCVNVAKITYPGFSKHPHKWVQFLNDIFERIMKEIKYESTVVLHNFSWEASDCDNDAGDDDGVVSESHVIVSIPVDECTCSFCVMFFHTPEDECDDAIL